MNTTNNSQFDYSMFSLKDFCFFLKCGVDYSFNGYLSRNFTPFDISEVEMYEYLKFKTDNFDNYKFKLVFTEISNLCFGWNDLYNVESINGEIVNRYIGNLKINTDIDFFKPYSFLKSIFDIDKEKKKDFFMFTYFVKLAENLYQTICEQAPGNTMEGTPEPKPFAGLLMELNDNQLEQLYNFLTTGQEHKNNYYRNPYIDKEKNDRQSFDHIFGKDKEKPKNFKPIEWLATKQLLRELLTGLQKEIKYNRQNPETRELSNEIVRQTPNYFLKDKTPLELAGNKLIPSWGSEDIKGFLATI